MEITKEIQELIQKQLPGIHATALKEYLEEAAANKKDLARIAKELHETKALVSDKATTIIDLTTKLARVQDIEAREVKLRKEEIALELSALRHQITKEIEAIKVMEAEKRAADAVIIATLLVKNPVLSEKFFEEKYVPGGYTNNADGSTRYHNSGSATEERNYTKEITKQS